jgi:glycosyltransferase involved in cell wall biosynthesis
MIGLRAASVEGRRLDRTSLRVLALPAFKTAEDNPYNALLYTHLAQLGVIIDEWSSARLRSRSYDLVHIHWPEYVLYSSRGSVALLRMLRFLQNLVFCKRHGIKVLWTVHDLGSHDSRHPRLDPVLWWCFTRLVDCTISLTYAGQVEAFHRFPRLRRRPGFVVPHGHYRGAYPDTVHRKDARSQLGIADGVPLLVFFGRIRAYKDVIALVDAFRSLAHPTARLLIAGEPLPVELGEAVRQAVDGSPRITLRIGFVPADEIQVLLRAADLVVAPYRRILNSGTALLALSFGTPVLVPALGSLTDVQSSVGSEYVRTFDGPISSEVLGAAISWLATRQAVAPPNLDTISWPVVAQQTLEAYSALISGRSQSGTDSPAP